MKFRFSPLRCLFVACLCLFTTQTLRAQSIDYFTPEVGQVGQPINIFGTGFYVGPGNQISAVWFGDTPVPPGQFTVTTPMQMYASVPAGAVSGPISVKLPSGPRVYSTIDFTVIGPYPYITGFTPNYGPGGTEITIDGVQFQSNVTAVKINGTNVPNGDVFIQSDTRMKVIAPANVTTGPITLVGFGTGSSTTTDLFYVPPVIYGFSPPSGRAGEDLTINGINFTNATEVRIGNVQMPVFNVNGNTQIVATVPSGAISGKVIVKTPGGALGQQYQTSTNFTLLPSITGFTPQVGTANTQVTISGANLNVPPLGVQFNGVSASIVSSNFNQIVAIAPASSSGPIKVTTGDGSVTSAGVFYYPPSISSFTPGFGGAGTLVKISGSSLTNATAVRFGNAAALYFTVSNNVVIGAAAPNDVSTGQLTITAPGGEAVSAALFYGLATFTGFLPVEGLPGTDVILFGNNFEGASAVAFNGTPAPLISNTGDQIGTKVPTNATSGSISITTPAGTFTSSSSFTVLGICDLRVNTFQNIPNSLTVSNDLTLTIVPSNNGPNDASNVTASVTLGPGVVVKSASASQGTINTNGNPVVFSLGTVSIFNNPTLSLVVVPQKSGALTNTVTLASTTFDSNEGNNTDESVTAVLPVAELSIDRGAGNQVLIAWPVSLTNYLLQSSPALTSNPPWANVSTMPVIVGDERVVTEPATGATKFYRLKN